jgi:hypothetical protein
MGNVKQSNVAGFPLNHWQASLQACAESTTPTPLFHNRRGLQERPDSVALAGARHGEFFSLTAGGDNPTLFPQGVQTFE